MARKSRTDYIDPGLAVNNSNIAVNNAANNQDNSNTNYWQLYQARIAENTVNQKAELAAINQRANSYTNAYLKSLGLSGTSAGASQIAENSLNLANSYNQINANQQTALEAERARNENALSTAYNNAVKNGESARYLEDLLSRYDDNSLSAGYKQQLRDAAGSEATWEHERGVITDDLSEQLNTYKNKLNAYQKDKVNTLIDSLNNAKTIDEYYAIVDEIDSNILKDIRNVNKSDEQSTMEANIKSGNYNNKYTLSDFKNENWILARESSFKNGSKYQMKKNGKVKTYYYKDGYFYEM